MKLALIFLTAAAAVLQLHAAVPLSWTVETSRAQPATFEAYQGETLTFEAALQAHGKPLEAPLNYSFFWQTNGMGSTYWEAPVDSLELRAKSLGDAPSSELQALSSDPTNVLFATWLPAYDVGAKVYNCFIGSPSNIYHAAFQLRLRPSPGATPNALPLPQPVIDFAKVRVLNPPWPGGGGGVDTNAVRDIISDQLATNGIRAVDGATALKIAPYLYERTYDDTYPEDAAWYYAQPQPYGSCSAVRSGNYLYRNYDWKFDDSSEFVVRVSGNADGRFASVGVANCGTNLTEQFVMSGKPSRYYKCLPGRVVDGINENGVVAEINVVDGNPQTSGWRNMYDIHPLGAVRWALDNGKTAEDVATNLAARITFPSGWAQNFHYMIADERETWIVENGVASNVTDVAAKRVMTNFKILTDDYAGMGAERYQLLRDGENITNAWFTKAYSWNTQPPWMSEFYNDEALYRTACNFWNNGWTKEQHRGDTYMGQTWWQSVHTSIYDISNHVLRVAVQETDDWYVFQVPVGGTDEDAVREIAEAVVAPVEATAELALDQADTANTHALMAKDAADTAKALAQAAQSTANQAVTDAGNAQTTAAAAQSTADQAVTDAGNAQTAAVAAQSTADNAQNTASIAEETGYYAQQSAAAAQSTADEAKAMIDHTNETFSNEVATVAKTVQPTTVRAYDSVRRCWWVLEIVNGVPTWTVED